MQRIRIYSLRRTNITKPDALSASVPAKPFISLKWYIALPFLIFACSLFILHFAYFRYSLPSNNVDEASFFSPAYDLATHNHLGSPVHSHFLPGIADHTYWMPPFYMVLLGCVLKLFPTTILTAKTFSMAMVLLAAFSMTRLTKDLYTRIVLASLLLLCPFVILSSSFIRMEALGLVVSTLAILAVHFRAHPIIAGVIAGTAIMTHPLLLATAAGLGMVYLTDRRKELWIFLVATILTLSPYLLYILQDPEAFREQMILQFIRKSTHSISGVSAGYLAQIIPLAAIGIWNLIRIRQQHSMKVFLYTALILATLVIIKSNEFNYHIYLIPYILASLALIMQQKRDSFVFYTLLPLLLYCFFGALDYMKIKKYGFRNDNAYHELISYIQQNKTLQGKQVYVSGNPDVAAYMISQGQNAERENAVASIKKPDWISSFDCVVEVTEGNNESPLKNQKKYIPEKPWRSWAHMESFITTNQSTAITIYTK